MRTTLVLEDSVFEKAKRYAFEKGTTLSELTSLALNSLLMREASHVNKKKKKKYTLPTYGTPGGKFLTLEEMAELRDEGYEVI
ncbi:MAG: hypothetical protein NT164_06565 [Verrucomicrobiae bacterium]|nr:hypothetical protein [Verrucomicrobiae bacterium]